MPASRRSPMSTSEPASRKQAVAHAPPPIRDRTSPTSASGRIRTVYKGTVTRFAGTLYSGSLPKTPAMIGRVASDATTVTASMPVIHVPSPGSAWCLASASRMPAVAAKESHRDSDAMAAGSINRISINAASRVFSGSLRRRSSQAMAAAASIIAARCAGNGQPARVA